MESDPFEDEDWDDSSGNFDARPKQGLPPADEKRSPLQDRAESRSSSSTTLRSMLPSEGREQNAEPTFVDDAEFIDHIDDIQHSATAAKGLWCERCRARLSPGSSFCEECESQVISSDSETPPANFRQVLGVSLKLYSENFVLCMAASLIDLVMMCIAVLLVLVPSMMVAAVVGRNGPIAFPAMMFVFFLGILVAFSTLWVGQIRFFHALARGQSPSVSELFQVGPMTGRMAAATLLYGTVISVGGLMFLIPGLIAAVFLWPYARFLIDHNCDSSDSLVGAVKITTRNFVCSALVILVFGLVTWLAAAIPLGIFFVRPFQSLFFSVAYLHMKGEFVTGVKQPDKANSKPGLLRSP